MIRQILRLLCTVAGVLLFPLLAWAKPLVVQLPHEHDFRAAGLYAAQWKGYYKDAGLSVDVRSVYRLSGERIDSLQALNDRQVDLAIGQASDIVIASAHGHQLALVAPVFSRSSAILLCARPMCTATSEAQPLRIGATSSYLNLLLDTDIVQQLFSEQTIEVVETPLIKDALANGLVDVLLTSRLLLRQSDGEAGEERAFVKSLNGFVERFNGEAIYTLSEFAQQHSAQIAHFRMATLKGWHYALTHPQEIAELIASGLPRYQQGLDDPVGHNLAIAHNIGQFMPDDTELGVYNASDWFRMQRLLIEHKVIPPYSALPAYLPDEPLVERDYHRLMRFLACVLLVCAGVFFRRYLIRWHRYMIAGLLLICMVGVHWQVEQYLQSRAEREARVRVFQQLAVIRADIEGILINSLSLLQGLAAHIASDPQLTSDDFTRFASQIIERGEYNINYAAAPNMVLEYVYPLEGNEKAIGLNYLTHPEQRRGAVQARDKRKMVVTDPTLLVQGRTAIIAHAPVYYRQSASDELKFWGVVSTPVDINSIFHDSGLFNREELQIAIRSRAASGKISKQVMGDSAIFSREPVILELNVGDKHWQIAAVPTEGSWHVSAWLWPIRLGSLMVSISLLAMLFVFLNRSEERKRFLQTLQFRETLLQDVGRIAKIGAWEYDCLSGNRFWSHALYRIFHLPESPRAPTKEQEYLKLSAEARPLLSRAMERAIQQGEEFDLELPLQEMSSESRWVRYIGIPVRDGDKVISVRGAIQDITQKKHAEQTILKQANYDALTNLPNRNLFDEQLALHIAYCERSKEKFVLLFFDLDQFKSINDSLGHSVGDELLVSVADRLSKNVRKSDFFSRRSGDEFTLLITQVGSHVAAEQVAKGMLEQFVEPFDIQGKQIYTSASIGLTIYPDDGLTASQLLKNADQAMYAAKDQGRNRFSYFTEKMQHSADQKLNLQTELIGALGRDEIEVFYQPIIDLSSGKICKCEALLRWNHPQQGYIPPMTFIPIAEEFGVITKLGRFVMDRACNDIAHLNQRFDTHINVAINKSVREFEGCQEEEADWIDALMGKAIFPNVTIEITESLLMGGNKSIRAKLEKLKQEGAKIAIDDFGTGYSSLSYLKRFPIDIIKIDRSFVKDINHDGEARVLVEAILAMAVSLGIDVVAEGVETDEQQQIIINSRCRYGQGYLYSKPVPIDEFSALVKAQLHSDA